MQICSLCKERLGACIQCDVKTCFSAFHVSCARKHKLLMAMKNLPGQEDTPLRAFCEKHLPVSISTASCLLNANSLNNCMQKELKELRDAASLPPTNSLEPSNTDNAVSDDEFDGFDEGHHLRSAKSNNSSYLQHEQNALTTLPTHQSKTARAYSTKFTTGPPLVPHIIVEKIMSYIGKVTVRKKNAFVLSVCKYWSLKREARRGAPLLKRLHLEVNYQLIFSLSSI